MPLFTIDFFLIIFGTFPFKSYVHILITLHYFSSLLLSTSRSLINQQDLTFIGTVFLSG